MKRFYKTVALVEQEGGHAIHLDGRAVKTPQRATLLLPSMALAQAVAAEWEAQTEEINPRAMPLTGLSNAAIDQAATDPAGFAETIARYAETDLLCYRAESPDDLVARQAAAWDPLLGWARERFDIGFVIATGIIHRAQPEQTVARLRQAVEALDPFRLTALQPLTTIGGSLVTALALLEGQVDATTAFDVTHLDELWQAEIWGEDWMAADARTARRADFDAAAHFLTLL